MRRSLGMSLVWAAATSAIVGAVAIPASAVPSTSRFDRFAICVPGVDSAVGNPRYPYQFNLSTRLEHTADRHIQASVRSIQDLLGWGFGAPRPFVFGEVIVVDGSYGAQTRRAVKAYQRYAGLTVDGIVGPRTWVSLARTNWCSWHH